MAAARAVARAFERGIGPLRLAESWDNVRMGLESPVSQKNKNKILLTIDLTTAVAEEALSTPTSLIVSYHPPIFSGLKSLTLGNPLQRSLLRCAASGISVFSPHTALDSVRGGVNDTLAASLGSHSTIDILGEIKENDAGAGRLVTLAEPVNLATLCDRVKSYCGLKNLQVGVSPKHNSVTEGVIRTIAICAGSGGSVLKGARADVYLTGEMSHHEVLAAAAQGTSVILCGHSNTERPYLPTLRERLQQALDQDTELEGEKYEVVVSVADKDPLTIL
ncbi:NIF3 (NGG1p interacting factor 3) [Ceratobasidium sp. AG-Ba]|nr:NIF3 (NGG1p interacting factor 3) [Ceratobasidium sp. AG-Ba]